MSLFSLLRCHAPFAALGVTVSLVACDERPAVPVSGRPVTRDSAGITIVENATPAWAAGAEWTVDSVTPALDIGTQSGEAEYELHAVRAAVRLRDGRIAVANMGTNQIRFFDGAGTFVKNVGRSGQGPGEFEQLWRLKRISDDSLMALEPADLTSIFTAEGRFIRRFRLDPAKGYTNLWWIGRFDSGYLLVFSLARIGTRELQPNPDRKLAPNEEEARISIPQKPAGYRDSLMHFLYTMDGHLVDTIARLPSQWVGSQVVFAPNAAYAFDGDRFYHSPGDRVEIREFTLATANRTPPTSTAPAGPVHVASVRLTRIVRVPSNRDLTVTRPDSQHYKDGMRAQYKQLGRMSDDQINRILENSRTPMAPRLPAHANKMYVDPTHALWLQQYDSDEQAPGRWSIIDSTGAFLGVVTSPSRFTLSEIGIDYALGVWRDSLDVEHVRMYRLSRGRR